MARPVRGFARNTFEVEGLRQLQGGMVRLVDDSRNTLSAVVARGGVLMKEKAAGQVVRANAVKSGDLRDSFQVKHTKLTAIIYTDIRYAAFVEFGQSRSGPRVPKPFLFPSFSISSPVVTRDAHKSLVSSIRKVARDIARATGREIVV